MLLSEDLRYLVEEEEPPPFSPKPVTHPKYTRCLEVVNDLRSGSATVDSVDVPDDQLEAWLDRALAVDPSGVHQGEGISPGIRKVNLLLLPVYGRLEYRTPFSNNAVRGALSLAKKPHEAFRLLARGETQYFDVPMEKRGKGIIVRMEGNNERLVNSASMIAINKDCTQTCVILRVYDRGGMEFFVDRINELKSCVWHPCVMATLQIERRLTKIKEQLQDHKHHLEAMERTAGLYKAHRLDPEYRRGQGMMQPWNSKYFETLGSELTSVKSDVLYQQYKCSRFLDMLGFLDHVAAQLDDCPEFRMKSRFMRSTISGYEERSRYLSARAEATMQTYFSLMSQRDNQLNLELANLSRDDNKRMQEMAAASYRHSSDMRAITLITLFFLPATFVATFFSTTFFDFNKDQRIASTYIWIYWVVTVVLTAAVLGGWVYHSDGFRKKAPKEEDDQEGIMSGREDAEPSPQGK